MQHGGKPGEASGGIVLASMVLAFIAQLVLTRVHWAPALVLYAIAFVAFGLAARRNLVITRTEPPVPDVEAGDGRWPDRSLGLFAVAILLLVVLWLVADPLDWSVATRVIQVVTILVFLAAGIVADRGRPAAAPLPRSPVEVSPWVARGLLTLIVFGGVWFRFVNLDELPAGFWFDEADVGLFARRILDDASYRPVFDGVMPAFHAYLIAIVSSIFGEGVMAVRSVTALFGVGTILAGYLAGRELFGRTAGLILAFTVAFSRWSLTLSRIAMHNVMVPFFSLLTLGLLLRAYRRRSTLDFILAGFAAGAGMLFYSAFAAAIIAIALFALVLAFRYRNRWRWALPRLAAAFLASLALFVPLGKFMIEEGDTYFARNRTTALWGEAANVPDGDEWKAFRGNIAAYGLMSHYEGDPNGRHNIPGEPMLPTLIASLSVLGLSVAVFRLTRHVLPLALIWVPMSLAPGILSLPWERPNSLRAVAAQPVTFLLATAAIAAVLPALSSSRRLRFVSFGLIAVALLGTGVREMSAYFGRQADNFSVWAVHSTKETEAANLVAAEPPDTEVLAVGYLQGQLTVDFLSERRGVDHWFPTDVTLPLAVPDDKDALIITFPNARPLEEQARRLYPEAVIETYPGPGDQPEGENWAAELVSIRIPADAIADSRGWDLIETGPTDPEDPDGAPTRTWLAALVTEDAGLYDLRVAGDAASFSIDGADLLACDGEPATLGLAAGVHVMTVVTDTDADEPTVEWRAPDTADDEEWATLPAEYILQPRFIEGGLLGLWHEGGIGSGGEITRRIDSTIEMPFHWIPYPHPYTVEWSGGLFVPESGSYTLIVETDDATELVIDGEVVSTTTIDGGQSIASIDLDTGVVDLTLRYHDEQGGSRIFLRWIPPGESESVVIPASHLTPYLPEDAPDATCG